MFLKRRQKRLRTHSIILRFHESHIRKGRRSRFNSNRITHRHSPTGIPANLPTIPGKPQQFRNYYISTYNTYVLNNNPISTDWLSLILSDDILFFVPQVVQSRRMCNLSIYPRLYGRTPSLPVLQFTDVNKTCLYGITRQRAHTSSKTLVDKKVPFLIHHNNECSYSPLSSNYLPV